MTYEQAHKFLEVKQRAMTKNRGLYNELEISINGKAIEAVEKQIPRQIKIIRGEDCCPTCGYDYGPETTRKRLIHWDVPYCKKCGQRLTWKNGEEVSE